MLTKYAEAEVIDAYVVPKNAGPQRLARVRRQAHRANFNYTPRPGYIYVRSRAISSRTNDNFDSFPAEEIKKSYATFVGKPVFVNHHNADHRRARGVIIDAALHEDTNPDGTPDTWAEVLMEVDAVRFPVLAREVLKGNIARTSMGTDVAYSVCTACGNKAATPVDYCKHIPRMKGMKVHRTLASGAKEEVLVAEVCYGLGFFENSLLVEDPADPTAFVLGVEEGGMDRAAAKAVIDEAESIVAEAAGSAETSAVTALLDEVEPDAPQRTASVRDGYCTALVNRGQSYCPCNEPHDIDLSFDGWQVCGCGHTVAAHSGAAQVAASHKAVHRIAHLTSIRREDLFEQRPDMVSQAMHHLAYGETKAPAKVDTMRAENCPVCGDDEAFNGERCNVCGFMQPPSQFQDPDLDKAKQMDLRQDQAEDAGLDQNGVGADGPLNATAPEQQPGQDGAGEDLQCTNCGEVFSAEGDPATSPDAADEGDPEQAATPEADPEHPSTTQDRDRQKADGDNPLDELADKTDKELGLEDEDDEEDPRAEKPKAADEEADASATGEGRVTDDKGHHEPGDDPVDEDSDPLAGIDEEIAPNMTCPVCGQGTLIPVATQPVDEQQPNEPALNEVGVNPKPQTKTTSAHGRGLSKETVEMNQPNPAQERRNLIIAAIREQQGVIEAQAAQINDLTQGLATLAVAAGVGAHPKFAGIVRAAGLKVADSAQNPEGAPATSTEEAKKPQATDDVTSPGAAPSEVNKDVTPKGVTDVQSTDVVDNPPVLDNLQDVTAPTSGTDAVHPAAATGTGEVRVTAPATESFDKPGDSGWKGGPQSVNRSAAMGSETERFTASLRLARLRLTSGLADGEDLAVAQKIAASEATLGEISAEAHALQAVTAKQASAQPTPEQRRRLVPTRAVQAAQQGQPSMQATAQPTGRENDDEWMVGSVD